MATVKTKLDTAGAHSVLGDKIPEVTRRDNQIVTIGGMPCEFHHVTVDGAVAETALDLTTGLKRVIGGMVYGLTEAAFVTHVLPSATDPTHGIAQATLPVSRVYLILIWGSEV